MKEKKNKGFTLIELVIVVAILAILVGVLAPQYTKYVEKSRKAADASNMSELVNAFKVFVIDGGQLNNTEYVFAITPNPSKGTGGGTQLRCNKGEDGFTAELDAAFPKWRSMTTKSKKWGDNGTAEEIRAVIKVTSDGGVSVSYEPAKFAAYMGNGE